ncbi:MAG: ribosomal RNA small subunit methyltransferase A [Candidatus Coatesbacteria bacterium]|nr:ribosomal RNA small subunit methyltransferase A [Candidatus Coatesbacteria bacterium]
MSPIESCVVLEPKKSLGQVFLCDTNLLERVAKLAEPRGRIIVEIGAGDGRLTELLARDAALVYAVEMDKGLYQRLNERFNGSPNVIPVCRDARELDLYEAVFSLASSERIRVVGNLPYCSFVHILLALMNQLDRIDDIRVMGQREMAERLMAAPNTPEYGRLAVTVQVRTNVRRLLNAPRTAFWPRPKVDSTVVALTPRKPVFGSKEALNRFDEFVTAAFAHKRKTLINSLSHSEAFRDQREVVVRLLKQSGISSACRPQEIALDEYVSLFGRLNYEG